MNKISILIISMLLLLGISGCIDKEIENTTDEFDFNIAYGQNVFKGFYPWIGFINQQTLSINSNIFNSLVEFGDRYQIIPALAESWNNPNDLTWRFFLRKNVNFHNGDDFSADDVKYSIELIKEDKNNTFYSYLTMVKEVIIVDNFTVDVSTFEPYPLLLNKLAYIFMVSKQNHEGTSNGAPIGTGAYRFSEYGKGNDLVLERFEGYWREKPECRKVTFKFFNDYEDQLNNFLEGNVDIITSIDPKDYDYLSTILEVNILPYTFNTVTFIGFNFVGNNPCLDLRVRKAIYHAINIDEIIENVLAGSAEPASQFVSEYIFGYNSEIKRLSYDLIKARQYMKDAGYEKGFQITLDCRESEMRENVSRVIADQLSLINITVEVNILSSNDFYTKISNRESSFYFVGWATDSADAGEIFDNILRSADFENGFGVSNFGNYSNSVIDEIAENISYNMNPTVRLNLMKEGFAIAMEDVVCVPLYILKGYCIVSDEFSLPIRADGLIKLENIKLV